MPIHPSITLIPSNYGLHPNNGAEKCRGYESFCATSHPVRFMQSINAPLSTAPIGALGRTIIAISPDSRIISAERVDDYHATIQDEMSLAS